MSHQITRCRASRVAQSCLMLLSIVALGWPAWAAVTTTNLNSFRVRFLASDGSVTADNTSDTLVNPGTFAFNPNGGFQFSNTGAGVSTTSNPTGAFDNTTSIIIPSAFGTGVGGQPTAVVTNPDV